MAEEFSGGTRFFLFILIVCVYYVIGRGSAERKRASYDVVRAVETAVSRIERGTGFANFTLDLRLRQIAGIEGFFLSSGDVGALWDFASAVPDGGTILHIGARAGAVTAVLATAAVPSVDIVVVECLSCWLGRLPIEAKRLRETIAHVSHLRDRPIRVVDADAGLIPLDSEYSRSIASAHTVMHPASPDAPPRTGNASTSAHVPPRRVQSSAESFLLRLRTARHIRDLAHSSTDLSASSALLGAHPPPVHHADLIVFDATALAVRPHAFARTYLGLLASTNPATMCLPNAVAVHTPAATHPVAHRAMAAVGGPPPAAPRVLADTWHTDADGTRHRTTVRDAVPDFAARRAEHASEDRVDAAAPADPPASGGNGAHLAGRRDGAESEGVDEAEDAAAAAGDLVGAARGAHGGGNVSDAARLAVDGEGEGRGTGGGGGKQPLTVVRRTPSVTRSSLMLTTGAVVAPYQRRIGCCKPGSALWHLVPLSVSPECRTSVQAN